MSKEDFTDAIGKLEASIKTARSKVLIGGDFNSKSPEWNSNILDNRGALVCDMISGLDLAVFNVGQKLTFRRGSGGSIIDITFGTPGLYNERMNWAVLEDLTLSDHQYITFAIKECKNVTQPNKNIPKWNTRKLNEEKLVDFIQRCKETNLGIQEQVNNVDHAVKSLTKIITKACDVGMPRTKPYRNKSPVYWWNDEVRELRKKCLLARRAATRHHDDILLRLQFKNARKALRMSIKLSKRRCWLNLCKEIDSDPWGKPYKIVRKKFGMNKPIPGIKDPIWAKTIVEALFPLVETVGVVQAHQEDLEFHPLNVEEMKLASSRLKLGKCPGPDGIPNIALKLISESWPEILLNTFNLCLRNGCFPEKWKIQKLVLLRKGDKSLNEPSSYRPLCMLDSLGKLFESLILIRLSKQIDDIGGLSPNQYGFRKGRSTVDAINEVVQMAKTAKTSKGFCAIITLDVQNAFNTAKWDVIMDALREKGVQNYMFNIVNDYLNNRILLYETDMGLKAYKISAGVPQGSVLGPFLWNAMYDGLLNMRLPDGARLIGYADDIALVVSQPTAELIEIVANDSLSRCNRWIRSHGLQLAPAKTEAILVTSRRVYTKPKLTLQENEITFKRNLCYLGVQLDDRLSFSQHISNVRNKAICTATSLIRIMPNCGGPKPYTRKLISSVVHSQLLYAAPTFAAAMNQDNNVRQLLKAQRISALRIISAYRTVSTSAALVIASLPPADLQVREREEIYKEMKILRNEELNPTILKALESEIVENARTKTATKWQERWRNDERGRWTYALIPDIQPWVERKHGNVGYYLTQFLTNHGHFNQYLYRFKLTNTAACEICGEEESIKHIIFECPIWSNERQELNNIIGETITVENIIKIMLTTIDAWNYCEKYINMVVKNRCKECPNLPRRRT